MKGLGSFMSMASMIIKEGGGGIMLRKISACCVLAGYGFEICAALMVCHFKIYMNPCQQLKKKKICNLGFTFAAH